MCVSAAVESIERKAEQEQGSMMYDSNSKSLHGKCLSKPKTVNFDDENNKDEKNGEFGMKRGTVVLCEIKMGSSNNIVIVSRNYRVLVVYDKHCNKSFMYDESNKIGIINGKEGEEEIQAAVHMVDDGVLDAYKEVALDSEDCMPLPIFYFLRL